MATKVYFNGEWINQPLFIAVPVDKTVEQQLEEDRAIYGNAFYTIENGVKVRIDPTTVKIYLPAPHTKNNTVNKGKTLGYFTNKHYQNSK